MSNTSVTKERISKLREIVARRNASALGSVSDVGTGRLDSVAREALRDILTAELTERGLGENDEPTARGLEVEALLDMLGYD